MKDELLFWDIIKNMLMINTGSTTVLLEAIIGQELGVKVIEQGKSLSNYNLRWEGDTVCRETVLFIGETDVSHNMVYINWEGLDSDIRDGLVKGERPLGKVIMDIDQKRKITYSGPVTPEIQKECNIDASSDDIIKRYEIWSGDVCLFILYEVYYFEKLKYCVEQRRI
ncbi:MAG: hypothetical protein UHK60_09705 [Acutalibacteraceae bacterium]|nr:hypothetical protein [Acutalibacteraceae bacterium]